MKRVRVEMPDSERRDLYQKAIFITIVGNVFLMIIKGVLAWVSVVVVLFFLMQPIPYQIPYIV